MDFFKVLEQGDFLMPLFKAVAEDAESDSLEFLFYLCPVSSKIMLVFELIIYAKPLFYFYMNMLLCGLQTG